MAVAAVALFGACSAGEGEARPTSTTATSLEPATTAPLRFTGDPGSAFCEELRGLDVSTVLAGDGSDPASVEVAFRRLVAVLRDTHALAPPEIEEDLALVRDGIEALDAALAAVAYDFDALAASGDAAAVTAAVNDPVFAEAGDRLAAYRAQVCRL